MRITIFASILTFISIPQLIYKFLRNNEVPEKYRKQIADASEGKIKPYWFSPIYEDVP